jgi:hypothetical protein
MSRQQPQASAQQDPQFKLDGTPYDVDQMIGIGAYGQVRQAIDRVKTINLLNFLL